MKSSTKHKESMKLPLAATLMFTSTVVHAQGPGALVETVQVDSGTLRGTPRDAQGVLAYKGIAYASPPVGDLRWARPQPAKPWEGVRDATVLGHRCWVNTPEEGLGGSTKGIPQDEDCLYLNVWSPAKNIGEHRPVMVWIHGGGFQFGTSRDPRTDGALLAAKGVVLVSINYRIGVFGFFAHPKLREEGRLSGNFGIQDQIAALKWVKANIAKFGGDPTNVTVFGESAGSQSVSILMASPLAKGLFQKAIGESGSSLQQLPGAGELSLRGAAFGGALGASSIADLRAMPAERLNKAIFWDFHGGAPIIFAPCIDGYVLPTQVTSVFRSGQQNDVSLIAGYNKREEFAFLPETLPHRNAEEFRAAAEKVFGASRMPELLALYPAGTDAEAKVAAEQLFGDLRQKAETWRWLTLESQTGKAAVYGYQFSYESPYSPVASHVAEIPFIFGNFVPQFFNLNGPAADARDREVASTLMSYWVNFAKSGDPNGPGLPHWPEFRGQHSMLQVLADGRLAEDPPSANQLARFKFLEAFLVSASSGGA